MTEQRHADLGITPLDAPDGEDHHGRQQAMRRAKIAAVVAIVLLAVGAGRTVYSRMADAKVLEGHTAEAARQYVRVTQVQRSGKGQTLSLPGTLQGYVQSPIASRAAGYLKRWTKDIGSPVKQGELLAEIESPEIDQQLTQAIAARDQAAASLALARSTVERWEGLRKKDVVSQQDLEEKRSTAAQAQSNVAAAEANVQRLRQLEGFKRIVAPFAGVITRRNVDVGDLIDSSRVLFLLSQSDALRVYVNVPQSYAQLVKPGQTVVVTQGELRGQRFEGKVARTAGAIDTATRTLQVEVSLPNRDGALMPGAYVQVALPLAASQAMLVPTNALLFRAEGSMVAVVDAQGRVALRKVSVGRNYGADCEIAAGLQGGERIVLNPPDWLNDGQTVVVAAEPAASGSASAAASGPAVARAGESRP